MHGVGLTVVVVVEVAVLLLSTGTSERGKNRSQEYFLRRYGITIFLPTSTLVAPGTPVAPTSAGASETVASLAR